MKKYMIALYIRLSLEDAKTGQYEYFQPEKHPPGNMPLNCLNMPMRNLWSL